MKKGAHDLCVCVFENVLCVCVCVRNEWSSVGERETECENETKEWKKKKTNAVCWKSQKETHEHKKSNALAGNYRTMPPL